MYRICQSPDDSYTDKKKRCILLFFFYGTGHSSYFVMVSVLPEKRTDIFLLVLSIRKSNTFIVEKCGQAKAVASGTRNRQTAGRKI